jgi:hypothetical protein
LITSLVLRQQWQDIALVQIQAMLNQWQFLRSWSAGRCADDRMWCPNISSDRAACAPQINEYSGRLGWDATLLVYNLQSTSRWAYLGYEAVFVGGMALLLWAALAFKRTAPHYRVSIDLRRQ